MTLEELLAQVAWLQKDLVKRDQDVKFWHDSYVEMRNERDMLKEKYREVYSKSLGL